MNIIRAGHALAMMFMAIIVGSCTNNLALAALGTGHEYRLKNSRISWRGSVISGKLGPATLTDAINSQRLQLKAPCFRILLGNGKTVTSADCILAKPPERSPYTALTADR